MRKIKIPKNFFKPLNCKIKLPTIKCEHCNKEVLETPINRLINLIYEKTNYSRDNKK